MPALRVDQLKRYYNKWTTIATLPVNSAIVVNCLFLMFIKCVTGKIDNPLVNSPQIIWCAFLNQLYYCHLECKSYTTQLTNIKKCGIYGPTGKHGGYPKHNAGKVRRILSLLY